MAHTTDELLKMAAEKILRSSKKAAKATEQANAIALVNMRALQVIGEHRASVRALAESGKANIITVEFAQGMVEAALRDIKAALEGKTSAERCDD